MTMQEILNARFKARVYCQDNEEFIRENMEASGEGDFATEALEHYNLNAEAFGEPTIEGDEADEFLYAAKLVDSQGFVEHC